MPEAGAGAGSGEPADDGAPMFVVACRRCGWTREVSGEDDLYHVQRECREHWYPLHGKEWWDG
jgi:hypothetical protein